MLDRNPVFRAAHVVLVCVVAPVFATATLAQPSESAAEPSPADVVAPDAGSLPNDAAESDASFEELDEACSEEGVVLGEDKSHGTSSVTIVGPPSGLETIMVPSKLS